MVFLGVILIYIAIARPPSFGWTIFLLLLGVGSLMLGDKMRRSTDRVIELTRTELRDNTGQVIARVEDVVNVDRGFFAFKPSNGFLLSTRAPAGPRVWHPGMWWRIGKQIGVGGVTPGSQTKMMTEMLNVLIAERDGNIPE